MRFGLYTLIFILLELFLVAPLRIELSLEAYETSVQTTAVAIIGGMGEIRTHDFMDLQSIPLNHSSTIPLVGEGGRNRTHYARFWRPPLYH
jgi:hypothetical protein